ncbi:GNAT family N-acetyltransferase [Streptococcus pneumoniae]|nr:GNAT family N-acetyltransferase [Streptococcus pneumoniae]
MLATLESEARKKVGYLQVKTVAEGSNKDYDRTNDFYPKSFIPLSTRCNLQNP